MDKNELTEDEEILIGAGELPDWWKKVREGVVKTVRCRRSDVCDGSVMDGACRKCGVKQ